MLYINRLISIVILGSGLLLGAMAPAMPLEQYNKMNQDPHSGIVNGEVVEVNTKYQGTYTIFKVKQGGEEIWAATSRMELKKGDKVFFKPTEPMLNFSVKSIGITYDKILFLSDVKVQKL